MKIRGNTEEVLYYAFAEGDQIIFTFQSMDNKELTNLEILEYPSNSRFMEYKIKRIENKVLIVPRAGVYIFRLNNGNIFGRVCQIKIDRIPANERTKLFNSAVRWVERLDTSWNVYTKEVVSGYDTLLVRKTKRELIESSQYEELIMDKSQRVHSENSVYGESKTAVFFSLPENSASGMTRKNVVSWAYWVGVGEESNEAWKENCKIFTGLVKGVATAVTTPLGGLLIGKLSELAVPKIGEDVSYGLVDVQNRDLFVQGLQYRGFDFGKGVAGYKKFVNEDMLQGTWHIILSNDNAFQSINVNVKVVALIQKNVYEERPYTEQKITARYENKTFKEPFVKVTRIPIASE